MGVQNYLNRFAAADFRGNDEKEEIRTFYNFINDNGFLKSTIFTTKVAKEERYFT